MTELAGKRVLIVEDNPLLAFDLQDLLETTGAEVVGPALDLKKALSLAAENDLDAAMLDIELGEEHVWPLAHELQRHRTPFFFISAQCTAGELPEAFSGSVCLEKPAAQEKVLEHLRAIVC